MKECNACFGTGLVERRGQGKVCRLCGGSGKTETASVGAPFAVQLEPEPDIEETAEEKPKEGFLKQLFS